MLAAAPPLPRDDIDAVLDRTDDLIADSRYLEALRALSDVVVPVASRPKPALRRLLNEGWALMYLGSLDEALDCFQHARTLAEGPRFSDLDRSRTLFHLGACRFLGGRITNAVSLFTLALNLAGNTAAAGDTLRSRILDWRSRAYRLQREWNAAQVDAERSLELAEQAGDLRLAGLALMQCSLISERLGESWAARYYAERARTLAHQTGDRQTEARILNNLGGLSFLLDEPAQAVAFLTEAIDVAGEVGNVADAAQAVSSLAQVHLRLGAPLLAEEQAREALTILDARDDYLEERGNVTLVLGRALLEQDRTDAALTAFVDAEQLFQRLGLQSQLAAAWTAQADAWLRRDESRRAALLYRRAVEAIQDFHF